MHVVIGVVVVVVAIRFSLSLSLFFSLAVYREKKTLSFRLCCRQFEISVGGRRDVNALVVKKKQTIDRNFRVSFIVKLRSRIFRTGIHRQWVIKMEHLMPY